MKETLELIDKFPTHEKASVILELAHRLSIHTPELFQQISPVAALYLPRTIHHDLIPHILQYENIIQELLMQYYVSENNTICSTDIMPFFSIIQHTIESSSIPPDEDFMKWIIDLPDSPFKSMLQTAVQHNNLVHDAIAAGDFYHLWYTPNSSNQHTLIQKKRQAEEMARSLSILKNEIKEMEEQKQRSRDNLLPIFERMMESIFPGIYRQQMNHQATRVWNLICDYSC